MRLVCASLAAVMMLFSGGKVAEAGLIYNWVETDGQAVTGHLSALSSSQANGLIAQSDVTDFVFTINSEGTWKYGFAAYDNLLISTATADFTGTPATSYIYSYNALGNLYIGANSDNGPHLETWKTFTFDGNYTGTGYWTISGATASVPEPASVLLVGMGLAGVAWRFRRG